MKQYLSLLKHVLEEGEVRKDRTNIGVRSVFGTQTRYDLTKSFPLVTTKKIHLKSVIHELLWFIQGDTNTYYLNKNGVTIWDEWANETGSLGPIYGKQWRSWPDANNQSIDQLKKLIDQIKQNPLSRRHIVSSWNVGELDKMALPPCHMMFQFYVSTNRTLSCQMYQRSADLFLGVPFNIASYALLTMMIAQACDLVPEEFIHTIGDAHIYENHIEQVTLQLSRAPKSLPTMVLNQSVKSLFEFKYEDFQLIGYEPHSRIKAEVAV